MTKARLAVAVGSGFVALLFAYDAIAINRKPLTFVGGGKNLSAITDEKQLLEMGEMLDKLGEMGYSDGQGNRLKIGDRYRELVQQRRQKRLMYWSLAGFFSMIGLVALLRRPRPAPAPSEPSNLSDAEAASARLTYSRLPTVRLRELLASAADLRPGAAELVQQELDRRSHEDE